MFRNGLRRKGGVGDVIAGLVLYPMLGMVLLVLTCCAGGTAFYLVHTGQLQKTAWVLWAIFVLAQLMNINLGQPGTTFDPNQLIRFPLPLRQFVGLRLFFGLLSPANVLVALMSGATAIGVSIARPGLWPYAAIALLVFGLVNILFSRMLFAWVDRWLSTRRAREVFTAILFIGSIGFQYVNLSFTTGTSPRSRYMGAVSSRFTRVRKQAHPVLAALPPALITNALQSAEVRRFGAFTVMVAECAVYGAVFLAVFALRMRTEFRGEALGDVGFGGSVASGRLQIQLPLGTHAQRREPAQDRRSLLPAAMRAVLGKELIYARRNVGLFYGLVMPLAMVFIFAGRIATRNSTPWMFPGALAYVLLGVMPLSYNSFGLEGAGVQLYFLAPVRLRDVVLAKNLIGFSLGALYTLAAVAVIVVEVGAPPFRIVGPCLLWAAATLLFGASLGNRRALAAPKRIALSRLGGKQVSPLSALLSMSVLLGLAIIGAGTLQVARTSHESWLPLIAFSTLFAIAIAVYVTSLHRIDAYALAHRESLFEELCKS